MIDSIEQDAARRYAANLPNAGLIPQLAPNAILEATCRADRDGFTHLPTEGLHPALVAPLMQRIAVHDLTVQAALTGERKLLVEAMLLDGCISDPVSAERLVDDLLQAQKAFLPQFA